MAGLDEMYLRILALHHVNHLRFDSANLPSKARFAQRKVDCGECRDASVNGIGLCAYKVGELG